MKLHISTVLLLTCILLAGCKPTEKLQRQRAHTFYSEHPNEFARDCAYAFPVKDSIGQTTIDSIKSAANEDITSQLAELMMESNLLKLKFIADTSKLSRQYADQLNDLTKRIVDLNRQYKPCEPTIRYQTQTVYRENTARISSLQLSMDSLAQKLTSSRAETEKAEKQAEKSKKLATIRLLWLIGATGVFLIGFYLKIKNII